MRELWLKFGDFIMARIGDMIFLLEHGAAGQF
jgi:hypothetical protein